MVGEGGMVVGAYQTAMSSRLRLSSVADVSNLLGIEFRVYCARDRVCTSSASSVIRDEVRVAIETSRSRKNAPHCCVWLCLHRLDLWLCRIEGVCPACDEVFFCCPF